MCHSFVEWSPQNHCPNKFPSVRHELSKGLLLNIFLKFPNNENKALVNTAWQVSSWKDKALRDFQSPQDTINEETVELLQPYLTIDDGEAEQASKSIKGLLLWTRAMVGFYSVNKDVLPLKNNLAIQEAHHLVASKKLEDAEKVLADKQKDLESVQKEYYDAMKHNEVARSFELTIAIKVLQQQFKLNHKFQSIYLHYTGK